MPVKAPARRAKSVRKVDPIEQQLNWSHLIQVALAMPGSVGDVYSRFYEYSFMNRILLMVQGVSEPVATYQRWQDMGRQVRKGEKGYAIVRPIVVSKRDEDGEVESTFRRFKAVRCLFTVSQTDGEPLPPVQPRGWDLDAALATLEVEQVEFASVDGNVQGYSTARRFAINPVAVDPTHTTFHELGHIVLGHTTDQGVADYLLHQGHAEFQAEAVAYLVLNELGQLTERAASHSRGYIQDWLAHEQPSDTAIRQVFTAVDTILKAGRQEIAS